MYFGQFEKMVMERGSLWSYEGLNPQESKGMTTRPRGHVELMI